MDFLLQLLLYFLLLVCLVYLLHFLLILVFLLLLVALLFLQLLPVVLVFLLLSQVFLLLLPEFQTGQALIEYFLISLSNTFVFYGVYSLTCNKALSHKLTRSNKRQKIQISVKKYNSQRFPVDYEGRNTCNYCRLIIPQRFQNYYRSNLS